MILAVGKDDLDVAFLKIDEIQSIDQKISGDVAAGFETDGVDLGRQGPVEEGFIFSRDLRVERSVLRLAGNDNS